jgi:hypothetical protein
VHVRKTILAAAGDKSEVVGFGYVYAPTGCGGAPFAYHSQREIPRGPGMFSGEEGAFVFRAPRAAPAPSADELREFEEWRQWKRRNAESPAVK